VNATLASEPILFDECYSSELERLELSQTTFVAVCCGVLLHSCNDDFDL
jgi:hypothetical protein